MNKNSQKNKKKNRRSTLTTFLLFFILAAGVGLLLYPSVSNYWNSFHQTKAIANYADEVANMENEEYDRIWQQAVAYNESLQGRQNQYRLSDEQRKEYESLLDRCITARVMPSCRSRSGIWTGPVFLSAAKAVTVWFRDTAVCPEQNCSPILTN